LQILKPNTIQPVDNKILNGSAIWSTDATDGWSNATKYVWCATVWYVFNANQFHSINNLKLTRSCRKTLIKNLKTAAKKRFYSALFIGYSFLNI